MHPIWRQEEKGTTEDEMVGWHHRLNGHEFEQAPGVGDGQGSLACCSPWGQSQTWLSGRTVTTTYSRIILRVPWSSTQQPTWFCSLSWAGSEWAAPRPLASFCWNRLLILGDSASRRLPLLPGNMRLCPASEQVCPLPVWSPPFSLGHLRHCAPGHP